MSANAQIDHLVIAAHTLDQGVQWCQATLGVGAGPGGEHPLMGTHNRLLPIASARYPRCYLEIISINPAASPPGRARWFDLDDPAMREALTIEPRLIHFVARTMTADAASAALRGLDIDRGELLAAQRATPAGLLEWRITVRPDGQRRFHGAMPTLIQWGKAHPADTLADAGLALQELRITHPLCDQLRAAHAAIGLDKVSVEPGGPNLIATLTTPRGLVTLESKGI